MRLKYLESSMSPSSSARRAAICFGLGLFLAGSASVFAQTYYGTNGTEYGISGPLVGDQVWPDAALNSAGGFLAWQDNATDGSGWGISALRLDNSLSGSLSSFRVNATGTNDQENVRVALLKNGGAVFVWQGGVEGSQHIYGRLLSSTNTFLSTTDVLVSVTNRFQMRPAVAVLEDSNIVVVWGSLNQATSNSMYDVYGQILSPKGVKVGTNFLVNQFMAFNQRTPSIAATKGGGFVVAWVSEQQRSAPAISSDASLPPTNVVSSLPAPSADVYARLYKSNGVAIGNEFLVNSNLFPCANPAVAASTDGGFTIVWGARNTADYTQGSDIYLRSFSSGGVGGPIVVVNTTLAGDQYVPRIAASGTNFLVTWTSLGQDGFLEGVYARFVRAGGMPAGGEFRVNTTTQGSQLHPVSASDGGQQFLVIWSSYGGYPNGMDLFGQRFMNVASLLAPMNAPYVFTPYVVSNNVYQPQLRVAWPVLLGISVSSYEVYVDGNPTPAGVTAGNTWTMTAADGLTAGSSHSFQIDYVTTDGHQSPLSPAAIGATWSGQTWGGVPYEWMVSYFGSDTNQWPSPAADSDGDGASNLQEFFAGTDPTSAGSVLRQRLVQTSEGIFLTWNTQPGLIYQVQVTTNLVTWTNVGSPRFANGTSDSLPIVGSPVGYYRIQVQR